MLSITRVLIAITSGLASAVSSSTSSEVLLVITEIHSSHWPCAAYCCTLGTRCFSYGWRTLITIASKFSCAITSGASINLAVAVAEIKTSITVKVLIKVRVASSGPPALTAHVFHPAGL